MNPTIIGQMFGNRFIPIIPNAPPLPVAVDSEMASNVGAFISPANTTLTYSFTNTAGTFLLVSAVIGSPGPTFTSVKYGGVAMTLVKEQIGHDGVTGALVAIYKLASPATGANDVEIIIAGGTSIITSGAISFTGEGASPLGTPVSSNASSGTITINVTGTATTSIVVDVAGCGAAMSSDTQTLSWAKNVDGSNYGNNGRSSRAAGNGGTVTLAHGDAGDGWGQVAVEVKI